MCACKRRADVCRNIHDDMNDLEVTCRLINLKKAVTFEPCMIKFGYMLILVVKCNVSYHVTCITVCILIYVYIIIYTLIKYTIQIPLNGPRGYNGQWYLNGI